MRGETDLNIYENEIHNCEDSYELSGHWRLTEYDAWNGLIEDQYIIKQREFRYDESGLALAQDILIRTSINESYQTSTENFQINFNYIGHPNGFGDIWFMNRMFLHNQVIIVDQNDNTFYSSNWERGPENGNGYYFKTKLEKLE